MAEPSRDHRGAGGWSRASARELLELLAARRQDLTIGEARRVLRNPFTTSEVIEGLLGARRLLASYELRSAIARHRRTPEAAAMRFIGGLYWRDLLEITVDVRISPAVRRVAEKYLVQRLKRLTVGEKVTLARRATREVLAHLRTDPSLRVIAALLENPRLTESALLPLVASESTLSRVLDLVASNPRWGRLYEIRLALSRNTLSPFRVILSILPTLRLSDLRTVALQEAHSSVVRHRADELLEARENVESI
ncbi:MAG: hypothetical protein GY719_00025 [bacterium]|nr:hypothetical protein [bacterium]